MTTLNIVSSTPKYKVTDNGMIEITLTDTANTYADGSNPSKTFTVNPIGNTMADLNRALVLTKEDAIDYFTVEAEKIARRLLVETGMNLATIPDLIFSGNPAGYTKTIKIEEDDGIILKDSIVLTPSVETAETNVYMVSALVMGSRENRRQAINVNVFWNQETGNTRLKELLIAEYHRITNPGYSDLQSEINNEIGIEVPTTSN